MKKYIAAVLFFIMVLNVFGSEQKTFIVLSGGGAKGIAHLPFLAQLKNNNVNFDAIVGVSAGAIAAALYSYYNGDIKKLNEVANQIYALDIFNDISKKLGEDAAAGRMPIFTIFFSEIKLLKKGSIYNIDEIRNFLYSVLGDTKLEDLPIPIYLTSLNINTGKYTVFTKGKLVPRILASMAIPGIFPPQEINGEYYVDGGYLDNIPVSVAYLMGATTVYLSDISDTLQNQKIVNNRAKLFLNLESIKGNYINYFERKMSTAYITYDLQNIKWYDFDKFEEIYKIAEEDITKGFTQNADINLNNILWYIKNQNIEVK